MSKKMRSGRRRQCLIPSVWDLVTVGGPILLAAVIAYAFLTRRKTALPEKQHRDEATQRANRRFGDLCVASHSASR